MFRITKQVEISHKIRHCDSDKLLLKWLRKISNALGYDTPEEYVASMFLTSKHQLTDKWVNKLHRFGCKHDTNDNSRTTKNKRSKSKQLDELPKDVFNKIGSYLSIKSSLNFSKTCHKYHKLVQNDDYFDQCDTQTAKLELSDKILDVVVKNNCTLGCYNVFALESLSFVTVPHSRNIHCTYHPSSDNMCSLGKMVDKINGNINRGNNNNNSNCVKNIVKKNHDIAWLIKILANTQKLFVSNNWICIFDHLPISWIFDKSLNGSGYGLNLVGSCSENQQLNYHHLQKFTTEYDRYMTNNNDNNNKSTQVRQLDRLWFNPGWFNIYQIMSLLHGNLNGISITFGDRLMIRSHDSLKPFLKIFHSKLKCLEISFQHDMYIDINNTNVNLNFRQAIVDYFIFGKMGLSHVTSHSSRAVPSLLGRFYTLNNHHDPNNRTSVVSTNDRKNAYGHDDENDENDKNRNEEEKILICDLNKTEEQLSFDAFLKKYNCNFKQLPQIKQLTLNFGQNKEHLLLKAMLNHEKLIKLFNFQNSVKDIELMYNSVENMKYQTDSAVNTISILENVNDVDVTLRIQVKTIWKDIEQCYNQYMIPLLVECAIKSNIKIVHLHIGNLWNYNTVKKYQIAITNQNQLLYQNRDYLRETIVGNMVTKALNSIKVIWHTRNAEIKIEKYGVEHVFSFARSYAV